MTRFLVAVAVLALGACVHNTPAPPPTSAKTLTSAEVLAATTAADWREPDPEHTLYVELATGRIVIELSPVFAPKHVLNIETLAREKYFDGLVILRVQDNYVAQWGDPEEEPSDQKPVAAAFSNLPGEFARDDDIPFTPLGDSDVYAPEVGFARGLPMARDGQAGKAWLTHCYGMVGAGRGDAPDSGSGKELYVVIGHAPRHLDRNVTLVGRVLKGIELLSTLPRGTGPLGFYESNDQHVPIKTIRVAADVPLGERTPIEVLRTDAVAFGEWIASRRWRRDGWFVDPAGHVEVCNVPIPVRKKQ